MGTWIAIAEILFWAMFGLVLYTYFGYPVLVTVWAALRPRPPRSGPHLPTVCLLIPAYNEEVVIEQKVRNSLALDYPKERLEILVISDESSDATNEIVSRYEDQGVRLIASSPRKGKARILNEYVPRSQADVIVVSDASVELAPDSLRLLMRPLADPEVGGAWGNKIYRNPGGSAAGAGESLYLRYEKFMKTRETLAGSIVSGEGSMLAFRRELFRPFPLNVADDFAISVNVVAAGKRFVYVPEALSFEDTAPSDAGEWHRKIRIIEGGLRGFFDVLPLANPLRTGFYAVSLITRQFLRRAVAPLYLGMALLLPPLATQGLVYQVLLAAAAVLLLLAGLGALARGRWRGVPLLFVPYYFLLVNLAALVAMSRLVAGSQQVTWEPTPRA